MIFQTPLSVLAGILYRLLLSPLIENADRWATIADCCNSHQVWKADTTFFGCKCAHLLRVIVDVAAIAHGKSNEISWNHLMLVSSLSQEDFTSRESGSCKVINQKLETVRDTWNFFKYLFFLSVDNFQFWTSLSGSRSHVVLVFGCLMTKQTFRDTV